MIKIINLEKKAGENRIIIHNFNVEIEQGEAVLVKGPSGCGKTTLLKILAMVDTYDSGQYFYDGRLVKCTHDMVNSKIRKYDIGYIPQNLHLIANLCAYENIMLSLRLQKNLNKAKEKIYEIAKYLEIENLLDTAAGRLSRGEQQRVAIARACVKKSRIIIADEPTASLDEEGRDKVMKLFIHMNQSGKTIILSSHDRVNENFISFGIELLQKER